MKEIDVAKLIMNDWYLPKKDLDVECTYIEKVLKIRFRKKIRKPLKMYLFSFDKKDKKCLSIQEIEQFEDDFITIKLNDNFISPLKNNASFKYGRVCCAFQWEKDVVESFFLRTPNLAETYIGNSDGLALYYSQGELLSVKFINIKKYYSNIVFGEISSLKMLEGKVYMSINMPNLPLDKLKFKLISKTTNRQSSNIMLNVESYDVNSNLLSIALVIDFTKLDSNNWDAYRIAIEYKQCELKVVFSNDFVDKRNVLSDIMHYFDKFDLAICKNSDDEMEIQIADHIYPYIFSIIMASYNTEKFLGEAVNSILKQDVSDLSSYVIGNISDNYRERIYKDFFEIILVNDGSSDSTGSICDMYASKYPNITVIHKENGGVSSARNAGIKIARGKYLNFADSDDKFSKNVLAESFIFFENNYAEVDVITFPIKFFDAASGNHWLNGKFNKGKRIINLFNEHDKSLLFVNASMFKASAVKVLNGFDESLQTGEDMKFIYSLFLNGQPKLGVLDKCTYWYRRRSTGEESAIQSSKKSINYYTAYLKDLLQWLAEKSKEHYGFIPEYVQYVIAQQIQWRYVEDKDASIAKSVLSVDEFEIYKDTLKELLQYIDIDIILEQKKIYREQKRYILSLKLNKLPERVFCGDDILYFYEGRQIATASTNYLRLEFLKLLDNEIYIEGFNMSFEENTEFYLKINEKYILLSSNDRDQAVYSLGNPIFYSTAFKYRMNLDNTISDYEIGFYERIDGYYIKKKEIRYNKTMPFSKSFSKSYFLQIPWIARLENSELKIRNLFISPEYLAKSYQFEKEFIQQVESKYKEEAEKRSQLLTIMSNYREGKQKKVWLISDRVNMAGDNGEALFLYLQEKNDPDIDIYFVINENCEDYERLRKFGKILIQNSWEHKVMHMLADCIISSQANEYVIDPFYHEKLTDVYRDLLSKVKFVFLQHGVIKDDLSDWLNRYKKNMTGFVTAAIPEYQSILDYDYSYTEKEVWLTGLPRHDRLYHDEKRYITIMPTWRKYLSEASKDDIDVTVVKEDFSESIFFEFYNSLLNHKRLLSAAEKFNYTVCFMPHPNLMENLDEFDHDVRVKFFGKEKPYREIYAESNLVMTDYSSSIMDFAYLRKPVVYCHFDQDEFFAGNHVYVKGYFEYERDGFGEVTYDIEALVDVMIEYMETECQIKAEYKERMDKFFAFNDRNNCERLYHKLKEL